MGIGATRIEHAWIAHKDSACQPVVGNGKSFNTVGETGTDGEILPEAKA
jgi:hypothetical protein